MRGAALERALPGLLQVGTAASAGLLAGGLALGRASLLSAGVALLIGTPVAASVVLALGMLARREWRFAAIALWVVLVLSSSLLLAARQ